MRTNLRNLVIGGRGGRQASLPRSDPALIQLLAGMQQLMATLTAALANPAPAPKKSFKTPTMKAPEPFGGTQPSKLRKFLQSVQTIFYNDQRTFETDKEKVMYTSSFLTGKAGKRIEPYLSQIYNDDPNYIINNWKIFETQMFTLYGNPNEV